MHRIQRTAAVFLALGLLLVLPSLARLRVTTKAQPDFDVSSLETFAWGSAQQRPPGSPMAEGEHMDRRVRALVEEHLAKRGYRVIDREDSPDFLVVYRTATGDGSDAGRPNAQVEGWVDLHHGGTSIDYAQGTLFIDLQDPETEKARWSGWVVGVAPQPQDLRKKIDKAVKKLVAKIPKRK